MKIFKTKRFEKPVICVGNLAVGGTGKTPHTEFIINQLKSKYAIAVLSRGYKRKTKGYKEVTLKSKVSDVGDEPLQIKLKNKSIQVAVDEDRAHGIDHLFAKENPADVVILDDAFQHRKVTAGYRILLTDYNRLLTRDYLLPVGRLREQRHNRKRAHCVIITKCPKDIKPFDIRILTKEMNLYPYQKLYFTTFAYKTLVPMRGTKPTIKTISELKGRTVIVVSGIANPKSLYQTLTDECEKLHKLKFPDHHHFTIKDLKLIKKKCEALKDKNPIVICTEKDAVKIRELQQKEPLKGVPFYYLPIEVQFLNQGQECFLSQLNKSLN